MASRFTAAAAVSVCLMAPLPAQHLSKEQVSQSPPEHVLSEIDIARTRPVDVAAKIGEPSRAEVFADEKFPGLDAKDYWWETGEVRLRAGTQFEKRNGKFVETEIRFVDVWGSRPSKNGLGITGAGLALGDSADKVRRCYGSRLSIEPSRLIVQWKDGTTLTIDTDHKGRIVHMQLVSGEAW